MQADGRSLFRRRHLVAAALAFLAASWVATRAGLAADGLRRAPAPAGFSKKEWDFVAPRLEATRRQFALAYLKVGLRTGNLPSIARGLRTWSADLRSFQITHDGGYNVFATKGAVTVFLACQQANELALLHRSEALAGPRSSENAGPSEHPGGGR